MEVHLLQPPRYQQTRHRRQQKDERLSDQPTLPRISTSVKRQQRPHYQSQQNLLQLQQRSAAAAAAVSSPRGSLQRLTPKSGAADHSSHNHQQKQQQRQRERQLSASLQVLNESQQPSRIYRTSKQQAATALTGRSAHHQHHNHNRLLPGRDHLGVTVASRRHTVDVNNDNSDGSSDSSSLASGPPASDGDPSDSVSASARDYGYLTEQETAFVAAWLHQVQNCWNPQEAPIDFGTTGELTLC